MTESLEDRSGDSPAESMSWIDIWGQALNQPTVSSYREIVTAADVTNSRALLWIAVSAIIGYLISQIVFLALGGSEQLQSVAGLAGLSLVCGAILVPIFAMIGIAFVTGITNGVASLLGGSGTYTQLLFAVAAYTSPISIVTSTLGGIPFLNLLIFPIGLYALLLNIIAVKAVHRFDWGRAIASSLIIYLLIIGLVACLLIGLLALLGPVIGNVFEGLDVPIP